MDRKIPFLLLFFIVFHQLFGKETTKVPVKYPYMVYLPADYQQSPSKKYPVLIYLHGGSHRGKDLEKLKEWGPPKLIDEGRNFSFIVVSPQCPANKLWISENWFEPLLDELSGKYRIDTSGIFVSGISMGGFGTWQVAMDFPGRIKAIVPLCGSCKDSVNICRINHIPVWAIHGVNDGLVSVKHSDRLVNRLKKCMGNVKYSRLENRHHGIWDLYEGEDIYEWFFQIYRKRTMQPIE
ncbi:MAG: phospholipase [Bacteroidales bacterium]